MSEGKSKSVADEIKEIASEDEGAFEYIARKGKKGKTELERIEELDTPAHIRKHTRKRENEKRGRPVGTPHKVAPGKHYGRPPIQRNEAIAQMVALYTACGISMEAIAHRFNMADQTLTRLYRSELVAGREINEMFWVGQLASAARKGKVDAIKFALERKFGWTETKHINLTDGESGIIFDGNRQPAQDITPE